MGFKNTAANRLSFKLKDITKDLINCQTLFEVYDTGVKRSNIDLNISLESFLESSGKQTDVGTEGFKDLLLSGLKYILDRLKAIINSIKEFFASWVGINIKNIDRHVTLLKNLNVKSNVVTIENFPGLGLGYSDYKGDLKNVKIKSFLSPASGVIGTNVEIVKFLAKTKFALVLPPAESEIFFTQMKNILIEKTNAIDSVFKPVFENEGLVFSREANATEFYKTYPREDFKVTVDVNMLLGSWSAYQKYLQNVDKMFPDLSKAVKDISEKISTLNKASDPQEHEKGYLQTLTNALTSVTVFQNYYIECFNQTLRFNYSVTKSLCAMMVPNFLNLDSEGVTVNLGVEHHNESSLFMNTMVYNDGTDEKIDLTEDFIQIEIPAIVSNSDKLGLEEYGLESLPMAISVPKEPEKLKEFGKKMLKFVTDILNWIGEKIKSFSVSLFKLLTSTEGRTEWIRKTLALTTVAKVPAGIVLDFTQKSIPYGPFTTSGKFNPVTLKDRIKSIGSITLLIEDMFSGLNPPVPSDFKKLQDRVSDLVRTFKDSGLTLQTYENGDLDVPEIDIELPDDKNLTEVGIPGNEIHQLRTSIGVLLPGFKDLYVAINMVKSATKRIERTNERAKKEILNPSAYDPEKPEEIVTARNKVIYHQELVIRSLKLLRLMASIIDNFTLSLYTITRKIISVTVVEKFSTEEFQSLRTLRDYIGNSLPSGGLNPREALTVNLASNYVKTTFGLEDFFIEPGLFLHPSTRKESTAMFLDKLDSIKGYS
jgi:hypothetical protein